MLGIAVSDIHGNELQYEKLLQLAINKKIDYIFMGGDLMPKTGGSWSPDNKIRTVRMQRTFIESFFIDYLHRLGKIAPVYAIFGNDDFMSNFNLVTEAGVPNVHFLNNQVIDLQGSSSDVSVAGYSHVALTPFLHKDWEKWDTLPGQTNQKVLRTDGYLIDEHTHTPIDFMEIDKHSSTIKKDLKCLLAESDPRKTIYLFHEAPYDTPIDQVAKDNKYIQADQVHVGSHAIREFIVNNSPLATIHGHIHETFEQSGDFRWLNGVSISFTPANDFTSDQLSYVIFDIETPLNATRQVY